MIMTTTATMT
jgi:hypothetical protein